ncbi:MAG: DUF4115 domain-containing protein [Woeseiaceae bacterium]|nr:DUF4115 domain-containing protein [Woeseiaceae bacterium]
MSDETDKQDAESEEQDARGPRAGERLAEARRAKQITIVEIAKELHLDEPKVRALERNDFETLGAPVFAKGHLRKYALLVDIDPDDVLTEYYEMNRSGPAPLVISSRAKPRTELTPGPWIALFVVAAFVALAYWWFAVREPATTAAPEPQMETSEPAPESMDEAVGETAADTRLEPEIQDVVDAPVTEPEPAAPEEPATSDVRLSMAFTGDCWTEITDAGGRRLYFGLGKTGRNVEVSGEAPLNVLFGDANNVSIAVDGVERPITPAERRGKTARFSITQP